MVIATATISTAPKTMFWAKMLTPRKVMPMRTTEMISAPTSVRQMLPTPPVIAVPPTTTAAIDGQQHLGGEGRRAAGEPAGEDDAGERGEAAGEHEGDDLLAVDLDAGGVGGGLAGADRGAVAAEAGVRLWRTWATTRTIEADDDHVGDAEGAAGDPGEIAALVGAERDRALAGDDQRGRRRARRPWRAWR